MRHKGVELKRKIAKDYIDGVKYKDIMKKYGVNRWDIQDSLSFFDMKTNRIISHPRLPIYRPKTNKKNSNKISLDGGDYDTDLSPRVNKNNPVLEDDLDIMERMDNMEDANDFVAERGYCEIVIDEDGNVGYKKNER